MYSGLEEVEEDSKQLQFSFVQSSGTDPVLDIMPDSVCSMFSTSPNSPQFEKYFFSCVVQISVILLV